MCYRITRCTSISIYYNIHTNNLRGTHNRIIIVVPVNILIFVLELCVGNWIKCTAWDHNNNVITISTTTLGLIGLQASSDQKLLQVRTCIIRFWLYPLAVCVQIAVMRLRWNCRLLPVINRSGKTFITKTWLRTWNFSQRSFWICRFYHIHSSLKLPLRRSVYTSCANNRI